MGGDDGIVEHSGTLKSSKEFRQRFRELPVTEIHAFTSVSKQVLLHNLSCRNEFDLQDNDRAIKTNFNMKGFAPRF